MPIQQTFYGCETADAPNVSGAFPGICTPRDLYGALTELWSRDTCAPRLREKWSPEDPTVGQCSVTAFLAQDVFGGKVYGVPLPDGNFHCYNAAGGCVFDLTDAQFLPEKLCYPCENEQSREVHFAKEEKRLRYKSLRQRLAEWCASRGI